MRFAVWLLSAHVAFSTMACALVHTGLGSGPDGGIDATASEAGAAGDASTTADAASADAASPDDAARPGDAGQPPDDAGRPPDDAGRPPDDAGGPPDADVPCQTRAIRACAASHSDVDDCTRLYDGLETAPRCPTQSQVSMDCRGSTTASYCGSSASCTGSGCVQEFWLRFDLGRSRAVSQLRFLAGWWADRPDLFEVWHSDSTSALPDAGATMVFSGSGATHPWRCVTGEACTAEVPDGCCPDGRGNPQVTDQRSYTPSCNLGTFFPKFNTASFVPAVGRYWYLMVRSGAYDDRIWLNEVELRIGSTCG